MKDTELKELLNAVYELEGMVHLSLNRKQDPQRLRELIVEKSETILGLATALTPDTEATPAEVENRMEEYVTEEDTEMANATLYEASHDAAGNPDKPTTKIAEPQPAPVTPKAPEPVKPVAPAYSSPRLPRDAKPRLRRCFPINEIYLFRRELFNGSDVDFNASLRVVEELQTYAEAEDYFINDLQWDPSDPNVETFLSIIRKNFKNR